MKRKTKATRSVRYEYDAFISYSSMDREWVRELVRRLRKEKVRIWFDEDLRLGAPIGHEIQTAIDKSKRFVFIVSENSISTDFPMAELQSVLFGDPLNKKGRLIPLRIDSVELPAFVAHFSCLDVVRNHNWFDVLVQACRDNLDRERSKSKIYIIDDHPIVIDGLSRAINEQEDMLVIGGAEDANIALQQIVRLKPDVVVLDIVLKDRSGVDLIRKLRASHPETDIIVYSMHDENVYAERCLRAGAMGYLMKGESSTRVLQGIRQVAGGSFFFSASLLGSIVSGGGPRGSSRGEPGRMLSDRQLKIFEMVGRGFDSQGMADKLGLNAKTVDAHKANIRQKLGLTSARELLMEAVRWVEK